MFSKKFQIIFIILAVLVAILLFFHESGEIKGVLIKEKVFFVEIAETERALEKGLSLHPSLKDDQGMLFIFPRKDDYGFWMKDMLFPLDIIWLDSNLKVVGLEKNISPETYPNVFYPKAKSLYVLEISAGQTDLLNLNIGDTVKFIRN